MVADPGLQSPEASLQASDGLERGYYSIAEAAAAGRQRIESATYRLAALVESSDDAIIGKTLEGVIVDWNRGAERLYGYSASEIVGQPISLLMPDDRPDELPAIMEKLKRGE